MKDNYSADHQVSRQDKKNWFMGFPIISDQISREGLRVVWRELDEVLARNVPGAVVEFGCYVGTTSLFIRRQLDKSGQLDREFHVYDSFEGLPDKARQDVSAAGVDFQRGQLNVSKKELLHQFKSASLKTPVIHKGWFDQLAEKDVPSQIAFAFLDGDFYGSILTSLQLVYPRMSQGGKILIDDYQRETLPGVERAVRDFFQNKPLVLRAQHNIAVITQSTRHPVS